MKIVLFLLCSTTTLLRSHLISGERNLKLWVWLLSYQLTLVQVKVDPIDFLHVNLFSNKQRIYAMWFLLSDQKASITEHLFSVDSSN